MLRGTFGQAGDGGGAECNDDGEGFAENDLDASFGRSTQPFIVFVKDSFDLTGSAHKVVVDFRHPEKALARAADLIVKARGGEVAYVAAATNPVDRWQRLVGRLARGVWLDASTSKV